tara:strand:+ start:111 stop:305 length:195 start_codon:yes stop_codon:yes gene_type:complete
LDFGSASAFFGSFSSTFSYFSTILFAFWKGPAGASLSGCGIFTSSFFGSSGFFSSTLAGTFGTS